ncbi:hypothetical protein MNV49_006833 [Pseudohyphozyma bogoriensis]|nr:hypothetical protein MNV49_006833 [Pseudohyphozyma bogoriensis]
MSYPLPAVPDGTNPYTFYSALFNSIYYKDLPPGLSSRLYGLIAVCAYVALAALTYLILTILECRQKGKKLWAWRLVARPEGRFIVGNQSLLEPLLGILSAAIYLSHIAVEIKVFFEMGDQSSLSAWRLVPWDFLFLQNWIVSWASLQSFILTNGHQPGLRWITPRLMNGAFLGVGAIQAVGLVVFDVLAGTNGKHLWSTFLGVRDELAAKATSWDGVALTYVPSFVQNAWDTILSGSGAILHETLGLLVIFTFSGFVTAMVNVASLFLIIVVRRQINVSLRNNFRTTITVPDFAPLSHSTEPDSDPARSVDGSAPVVINLLPATPVPPPHWTSVVEDDLPANPTSTGTTTHSRRSSLGGGGGLPVGGNGSGTKSKRSSRSISRAQVRHLAHGTEGIASEHAKQIMNLQRAEMDLMITGGSTGVFSLAITILSIYMAPDLQRSPTSSAVPPRNVSELDPNSFERVLAEGPAAASRPEWIEEVDERDETSEGSEGVRIRGEKEEDSDGVP